MKFCIMQNIELSYIRFSLHKPGNPVTACLLGDAA